MDRQKPSRSGTELMLDLARLLKAAVRIARAAAVAGLPGAAAAAVCCLAVWLMWQTGGSLWLLPAALTL